MDYKVVTLLSDAFNRQMMKLCVEAFEGQTLNSAKIYQMEALNVDKDFSKHMKRIRQAYRQYSLRTRQNCLDIQDLALALDHYSRYEAPPSVFKAILNGCGPFWSLGVRNQYNRMHVRNILEEDMDMPNFRATSVAGDSPSQVWTPEEQNRNIDINDPVGGHYARELHNIGLHITWNEPDE